MSPWAKYSLELWDALQESPAAPSSAGISTQDFTALLSFCFYVPLSPVFSYESVCRALEMEEQRGAASVAALVLQRAEGTVSLLVFSWGPGSRLKLRVPWCDAGDVQFSELQGLQRFPW